MRSISDKLKQVQDTIDAVCQRIGRDRRHVQLIVVTKTADAEAIQEVLQAGLCDFGENRVQHLKQVADEIADFQAGHAADGLLPPKVNWHMIGHLQRNKVRQTLKICNTLHSVDTLRLAEEINTEAFKLGVHPNVLLQVNCSGEAQKYGCPVGAAIHLAEQFNTMENLRLTGLMTMAPLTRDKERVRTCFRRARELFEEIRDERFAGAKFKHLSMGMSQDYDIAIEEGATLLRIGSAIFS
jgi:PLP dependent protein